MLRHRSILFFVARKESFCHRAKKLG
jgi:hypothetical protein